MARTPIARNYATFGLSARPFTGLSLWRHDLSRAVGSVTQLGVEQLVRFISGPGSHTSGTDIVLTYCCEQHRSRADPIRGLLRQRQQAAVFPGPAADAVELEGEQLVTFGYHDSRPVGANVSEGAIAESRDGCTPFASAVEWSES